MIQWLKKLFSKKNIVVYARNGKIYRFGTFAEAYSYMAN